MARFRNWVKTSSSAVSFAISSARRCQAKRRFATAFTGANAGYENRRSRVRVQRRVQVADLQLNYIGMGLAEYKRKRDFQKTAEPAGGKPLPRKVKGA